MNSSLQKATKTKRQGRRGFFTEGLKDLKGDSEIIDTADQWSKRIIGAAIEVHREKGPGLIESIYEKCMFRELELRGASAVKQLDVEIEHKGLVFREPLKVDLLVERSVLVELKAVERVLPIHKAQLLSYMKLLNVPLGLLINFHELLLKDGIHRLSCRPGFKKSHFESF